MERITRNHIAGFLCASLLLVAAPVYSLELNIPIAYQENTNWCWAACCQMTLLYYNVFEEQNDIVRSVYGSAVDKTLPLNNTTNKYGVNKVLVSLGNGTTGDPKFDNGLLSIGDIFTSIDQHKPILLLMDMGNNSYHIIMIKGYIDDSPTNPTIIINNPDEFAFYYSGDEDVELTYLQKRTGYWKWDESLRMTKKGAGGTGVFDGVSIAATDFTYTQPAGPRTYNGTFVRKYGSNAFATNWHWSLSFSHSGGDYVVASFDDPNGLSLSTNWNAPGFTLPSGYYWNYNGNGAVIGGLGLSCMDTDGYYHSDGKEITYTMPQTYPMVEYFARGEISTPQFDVNAHEIILFREFDIKQGANVRFLAGEEIVVKGDVTFRSGSNVSLIVDPALR